MTKHKKCYGKCDRCVWKNNGDCSEWNGWNHRARKGRSMIKGKFVATIEIDIAIDENTANLLPFEKLKTAVHNDMETAIKDMLCEEFGDIATVKVTKTFADLYRTEDKHESD